MKTKSEPPQYGWMAPAPNVRHAGLQQNWDLVNALTARKGTLEEGMLWLSPEREGLSSPPFLSAPSSQRKGLMGPGGSPTGSSKHHPNLPWGALDYLRSKGRTNWIFVLYQSHTFGVDNPKVFPSPRGNTSSKGHQERKILGNLTLEMVKMGLLWHSKTGFAMQLITTGFLKVTCISFPVPLRCKCSTQALRNFYLDHS